MILVNSIFYLLKGDSNSFILSQEALQVSSCRRRQFSSYMSNLNKSQRIVCCNRTPAKPANTSTHTIFRKLKQ